jgi:hypothetical protein
MMSRVFLLLLLSISCAALIYATDGPQTIHDKSITYTITANNIGGYKVVASVSEQETCLNVRRVDDRVIMLYESGHGKISRLSSSLNRKSVGRKYRYSETYEGGDVFLSDAKVHYLFFPETPKANDQLAYQFIQEFEDISYLPMLRFFNVDSQSTYRIVYKHPSNMTIDLDVFLSDPAARYEITRPSSKETVLSFRPITRAKSLYGYPFNDLHAVIIPIIRTDQPVTPSTPAAFVQWYGRQVNLQPRLDSVFHLPWLDSIRLLATPIDKLKALHDWVRTNIRYLFDSRQNHSIFPHSPSYVLSHSFGDCKDRAYLICALARELGIEVSMGLVSTEPPLPMKAIHIGLFDHVICFYQDGDRQIFFDPTARHHEFADPPETIIGHPALILDRTNPQMLPVTTTWETPEVEFQFDSHLDSLGQTRAKIALRRDQLATIRLTQKEQTSFSLQEALNRIVAVSLPQVSLSQCQIAENQDRVMIVTALADLSRLQIVTPTSRYFTRTPLAYGSAELFERTSDTLPVYNSSQMHIAVQISLSGASMATDLDSLSFGNDTTGSYLAVCRRTETGLQFRYELRRRATVLQGLAKAAYLDFWQKYLAEKKNMYLITGETK